MKNKQSFSQSLIVLILYKKSLIFKIHFISPRNTKKNENIEEIEN